MKTISVLLLTLVSLGCGYSAPKGMAPQPGVIPAIAQLVPNTANSGDPQFTLTVNGGNFGVTAVINWNGTAQSTTRMTGGQLTATIPATAIADPRNGAGYCNEPGYSRLRRHLRHGGGTTSETSNAMTFTVN